MRSDSPTADKPLPLPENVALTRPFWEGAQRHELQVQKCAQCGALIHFPREQCPRCACNKLTWCRVSGRGHIYSYTIVHQSHHPAFQRDTPYCLAIVELDEGPRMVTNIIGCAMDEIACGVPVQVAFDTVSDRCTLVKFSVVKR